MQRRAARIVTKLNSSDKAMDSLKWSPLEARRNYHVFKLVKKSINGRCPQFLKNYFTFNRDIVSRNTRQSNKLYIPKVRKEVAKRYFYYNGCIIFNQLDSR